MKKKLVITSILFLIFIQNINAQGWQWIDTGFPVHIFDMSFPPGQSNVGFAVGSTLIFNGDGIVLKTTDGGSNWMKISVDTLPGLKAVYFTSLNVGYAGGYQNFLMKTTDGGASWQSIMIDSKLWYFNKIKFYDDNNGVVISYPKSVYRTSDGGISWDSTYGVKRSVEDICYADDTNLFIVGGDQKIYKSTSGGFLWTEVYSGTLLQQFYGVDFLDENYGLVCGDSGKVLVTTDSGTNWTFNTVNNIVSLSDVHIIDAQNSFVVGSPEQIYKSTNAGSSWISDFNGGANISLYKILFTENHAGLISGSQGKILKNTDYIVPVELTSFTPVEYLLEQNFPNPFNPSTTISFVLPEAAEVTLKIYNTLGQKVDELVNTTLESGRYSYVWRAENFPNGTYIYELRANDFKLFKKMILLK
ncbi:MAG: Ycf48-like protein [Ignavibacteriaceae bacterium]|nr:Ycf48-like protein [Ignavibacteriaceae bacterium]